LACSASWKTAQRAIPERPKNRALIQFPCSRFAIFNDTIRTINVTAPIHSITWSSLQRHARELAANPAEWMPWNYRERLARLAVCGILMAEKDRLRLCQ
jgi:hypothetical protein